MNLEEFQAIFERYCKTYYERKDNLDKKIIRGTFWFHLFEIDFCRDLFDNRKEGFWLCNICAEIWDCFDYDLGISMSYNMLLAHRGEI